MKSRAKSSGFALMEAILTTILITSAVGYQQMHELERMEHLKANRLGNDLSKIINAIDHRILLDGQYLKDGTWDRQWTETHTVINEMLKKELIGNGNTCGVADGWQPIFEENYDIALLDCNFWNEKKMPMNFSVSALRSSVGDLELESWKIRLFHTDVDEQKRYFRFYSEIVNKAKDYDVTRATGRHEFNLVDLLTNETINPQRCHAIGLNCGIEASYVVDKTSIEVNNRDYLRIDGSNAMRASVSFRTTAGNAQCYSNNVGSRMSFGIEVDCGLKLDDQTHKVSGVFNNISVNSVTLTPDDIVEINNFSSFASPVPTRVYCRDENMEETFCGMSAVESGESWVAKSYLTAINADEVNFRRVAKVIDGDNPMVELFVVNENGQVDAKSVAIEAEGGSSDGGVMVTFDGDDVFVIDNSGNLVAKGNFKAESGAIKGNMTVEGTLEIKAQHQSTSLSLTQSFRDGDSCSPNGLLAIQNDGEMLNCIDAKWRGLLDPPPSGLIYATQSSNSCPTGFSKMSGANGRALVGKGTVSIDGHAETIGGGASVTTDADTHFMMKAEHLPSHTHDYEDLFVSGRNSAKKRGGGIADDERENKGLKSTNCNDCLPDGFDLYDPDTYHKYFDKAFSTQDPYVGVTFCVKN